MNREKVEADVLCVGGGIVGLMAAIRAAELGAKVVVAEKANTLRSGAGGVGNDHFVCYIPEVHGPMEPFVRRMVSSPRFGSMMLPESFWRIRLEKSFEMLKLWDSWGIPMKYEGKYEFAGHTLPGRESTNLSLKYSGQVQKPVLTREALKRGVEILNRVMVFDLIHDGAIIGAVGAHTREDRMIEFQAKSVILGTGGCIRLYPGATPGWMFNQHTAPSTTGDGRAMAFRAGVELINMESLAKGGGPKYFARSGRGTWVGVIRDSDGKPVGPYVTKPEKRYGDPILDRPSIFEEYAKAGKGPVYMDCRGISDEDLEYQTHWLNHEGNAALIDHLKEEGIDLQNNAVEFMTYGYFNPGGILHNEKSETSLKGLYAAGDEYVGQISTAAIFGWIAGENAVKYAREDAPEVDYSKVKAKFETTNSLLDSIRGRETGASWQEVLIALQHIMLDYAGPVRSEPILTAGLSHLRRLREKAHSVMMAKNAHELMHCLEVLNLADVGESVFVTALERKESRGSHRRADYPFTNTLLSKMLVCRKIGGKSVAEWRETNS